MTAVPSASMWSELTLQAILDACAAALVLLDAEGRIVLVNALATGLVGAGDRVGLVGRSAWEVLPTEIGLAATMIDSPGGVAGLVAVPEQVCADELGNRRRIAWSVRAVTPGLDGIDGMDGKDGHPERPPRFVLATGVDVTRERSAEAVWRQRAHTDPLTGLANRAAALDALAAHLDPFRSAGCAALFCDLDGFKTVNDRYGHAAGDHVLVATARRIKRLVREEDVVARLGGDEFLVILPAGGLYCARAVTARIEAQLVRPLRLPDGTTVHIDASIGIRIADPGNDAVAVLQAADDAMYARKRAKRARGRPTHPTAIPTADTQ